MIIISGIKHQEALEKLPVFNKDQAALLIGKSGKNLDKKLLQLAKKQYLLPIKKGLYTSAGFLDKTDASAFKEYLAGVLRFPSYLSLEYILAKNNLIPEAVVSLTSITLKSSRQFQTPFGNYLYQNINARLFCGFNTEDNNEFITYQASKAKAVFDFIYLKSFKNMKLEISTDLRINWSEFENQDVVEFTKYVQLSSSKKMNNALKLIRKIIL